MPRAQRLDRDADEPDILEDGQSISVRATNWQDAQRDELRRRHPPRGYGHDQFCGPVTDWAGNPMVGGGRPGFLYPASTSELATLQERGQDAYKATSRKLADAWRDYVATACAEGVPPLQYRGGPRGGEASGTRGVARSSLS